MAELKTKPTAASPTAFIKGIADPRKRADSTALMKLFKSSTGEKPKMWGESIVGFGTYHYKSERSRQEGDWPMTGFSPRKQNLTIYIMLGLDDMGDLLAKLGKHKRSVGCLYIKTLSDVDQKVLARIITTSYKLMKKKYRS